MVIHSAVDISPPCGSGIFAKIVLSVGIEQNMTICFVLRKLASSATIDQRELLRRTSG
jgi:hypothetical protein